MIWRRRELKKRARRLLKECYWPAVAVCLLTVMLTGWIGSAGISAGRLAPESSGVEMSEKRLRELKKDLRENNPIADYKISIFQKQLNLLMMIFVITATISIFLAGLLVIFFIGNPVRVSSKRFFMCNRIRRTDIGMILYVFRNHYTVHVTKVMFIRWAKIVAGCLMLVVPGIIRHYEYSLVPYILAENPRMDTERALELSSAMTEGEKMKMFRLDLSFVLWEAASALTLGLVSAFYLLPYKEFTKAELYHVLRQNALESRLCDYKELPGFDTDLAI